jgi:hypothetical protein
LTCGVAKHANKFSTSVGFYYLRGVDTTAYCEPALNQAVVPEEYCGEIGLTANTIAEWKDVFKAYAEQASSIAINKSVDGLHSIILKTPKKTRVSGSSFAEIIIPGELKNIVNQIDDLPSQSFWWDEEGLNTIFDVILFLTRSMAFPH